MLVSVQWVLATMIHTQSSENFDQERIFDEKHKRSTPKFTQWQKPNKERKLLWVDQTSA